MISSQGISADLFQPRHYPLLSPDKEPKKGLTIWQNQELARKPPQREWSGLLDTSKSRAFFLNSCVGLHGDIVELKKSYGFPDNDSVATFLANHRTIPSVLLAAIPHLRAHFGRDNIFNLEVSTDEDESQTLYVVAVWHSTIPSAARALENFSENWWLDHMTPSVADLAFTYEIF